MDQKITPGEIVVLGAGVVALIASFLPFFTIDDFGIDEDWSSWSTDLPTLFPVATLIAFAAVAAAVLLVLTKFANARLDTVVGIGFVQVLLALGIFATLLALAYLIQDFQGVDRGIGYFLLLLSAIASLVGAVLLMNERKAAGTGPGTGPG